MDDIPTPRGLAGIRLETPFLQEFAMSASLPFWIIGAPLILAVIDWIRTPRRRP